MCCMLYMLQRLPLPLSKQISLSVSVRRNKKFHNEVQPVFVDTLSRNVCEITCWKWSWTLQVLIWCSWGLLPCFGSSAGVIRSRFNSISDEIWWRYELVFFLFLVLFGDRVHSFKSIRGFQAAVDPEIKRLPWSLVLHRHLSLSANYIEEQTSISD